MKGGKQSRDYRKLAGWILRRVFSTLLWVACAGLFAQAAFAQSNGVMTIIAGNTVPPPTQNSCLPVITPTPLCNAGSAGDNGPAIQANLYSPSGVAFDPKNGMVYIADGRNGAIRQIDNGGTITTLWVLPGAGAGTNANAVTVSTDGHLYYGDSNGNVYKDGAVVGTFINTQIEALTTDNQGNLYVLETAQGSRYQLYEISASGSGPGLLGDTLATPGINTQSDKLYGVAASCSGSVCNVYSMDPGYTGGLTSTPTPTILDFVVPASGGVSITYVAQSAGTSAVFGQSLAIDSFGNFYINEGSAIVEYTPGAPSSVAVAGTGTSGYNGINGTGTSECTAIPGHGIPITCYYLGGIPLPATATDINQVTGIFVTAGGVLFIADTVNNLVRRESNSTSTGCQECGPTNLSLTDQLPVISYGIAVNPVTQELYVPLPSAIPSANGVVKVINAAYPFTDTLLGSSDTLLGSSITVGPSPTQVAIDSVNNFIYVLNGDSTVTVINGGSPGTPPTLPTVNATVAVAGRPATIAVDPPSKKAYVTSYNGSSISVIGPPDPTTGVFPSQATTVSTGAFPAFNTLSALAVDTNTKPGGGPASRANLLYARCFCLGTSLAGEENYSMAIIDATTDTVINEVSEFIGGSTTVYPDSMAVDETSGNVVIADVGNPSLREWSYANQAFNNPYYPSPSFYPNHVLVDSNNEIAYFTDGYGNSASLNFTTFQEFSLSQASNVANTCGAYSNVFAVDPNTDQAYMTTCPVTGPGIVNGSDTTVTSVQLSLIDGPTGSIITTLLLPTSGTDSADSSPSSLNGPFAIAENSSTGAVYVGNSVSNTINVVNGFPPAARPFLTFSANPLTFPSTALGTTPTATLTVTNDCSPRNGVNVTGICGGGIAQTPLTATVVNSQGGTGMIAPQGCTFPLAVFGSCQYSVTFTPTSSTFSGSIIFTDNALDTPQIVNFSGTYGLAAVPQISPSPLNFGTVPENVVVSLPITVTNPPGGNVPLIISNISIVPNGTDYTADFTENDNCQYSSAGFLAGASCTITVNYIPGTSINDTLGVTDTVTLQITDNALGSPQMVTVTGMTANPNYGYGTFSPTSLDFGNIEYNEPGVTQQITMTNSGGAALNITGFQVVGLNGTTSTDFQESNNCPAQLAIFGTCHFSVTFVPTSPPGTLGTLETAQILITDSSPTGSQTIPLSGTSSPPLGPPALSSLPELVSVDNSVPPNPAAFPAGGILVPAIAASLSSGGQFVVFSAAAENLPSPFQQFSGVFLRNTCLSAGSNCEQGTTFIAYGPVTGPGANGGAACGPGSGPTGYAPYLGSKYPAMDTTGEFVAFTSDACQFGTITSTNANQIYLRDLNSGTTSLVSLDATPGPVSLGVAEYSVLSSASPFSMSTDPKSLAFAYETASPSVVAGVTNPSATSEIYWTNVCTAQSPSPCTPSTLLVSQDNTNSNVVANNTAEEPSISADGRYVAFASNATNLASGVPANSTQVYLRDACPTGASGCTGTILISQNNSGNIASGSNPSVSSGGRFVAFVSSATNLLPAGVTTPQIFLRDTQNQTTTLLSQFNGSAGNGTSSYPFISADGRLITFMSNSSNLNSAASSDLAVYEYDTCLNAVGSCTAGLQVFLPFSTTTFSAGGAPAVVDATDQFASFDVFSNPAGYPLSQLWLGQTTVVVSSITVPNVVGLTQAAASTAITGAGLVVGTVTPASSSTVPSGSVISQSPLAGASAALGSAVNLLVSSGPAPVTVPDVVGLTQAAASTAITGAGLVVGTVTPASSSTVPSGSVISQSPLAGASAALGSAVNLLVSSGPGPVTVPNVVGLTQAAASMAITGAGLVVGTVTPASSSTVPSGSVISQSPLAGASAALGSAVNLLVSSGTLPPAVVMVNEPITVTDTPSTPDVFDPEAIKVTDQVTVTALPLTTTTLFSSNLNANQNTSITFTAQVSTASGNPTGTVTFFDGETQLAGTTGNPNPAPLVTVAGTTTAAYTTSSLSVGVHLLTAVYSGDSNFSGSLSFPPLVETISVPADFSLSAAPPSLIIQQGQSGTTTITITPVGNYSGMLSLSCPTLPSFASCTFTLGSTVVTSVTLDGKGTTVVVGLTVNTTGPNGLLGVSGRPAVWWDLQNMRPGRMPPMLPAAALWLMGILALGARQKNDKKLFGLLLLIVVLAGLGMLTACGSHSHATNGLVTPTGQSTAVVSVSGSTTHILDLTVTITPAP